MSVLNLNIALFFLMGCAFDGNKQVVDSFDISADDREIILGSYNSDGRGSIYSVNIDGGLASQVLKSTEEFSYANPRYSPDGKHILFIRYLNHDKKVNSLCQAKVDGSDIRELLKGELMTEAFFSNYNEDIFFCKANELTKYSPIGVMGPHKVDIYSLNKSNGEVRKISNLNSYNLSSISELDVDHILFELIAGDDKGGVYSIHKNSPNELKRIEIPTPRDVKYYDNAVYNPIENVLVFGAPYQLYAVVKNGNSARLIYDNASSRINVLRTFKTKGRIMFKMQSGENLLTAINVNGSNKKVVKISFHD